MLITKRIIIFLIVFTIGVGCDGGGIVKDQTGSKKLQRISNSASQDLTQKKIYFGHQSVGFNIVDGINDIMAVHANIQLNIIETSDHNNFKTGVFAHSRVGQNVNAASKIEAFKSIMHNGIGNKADIAFFKFCYVDITGKSDVEKLFQEYKTALSELTSQYEDTLFIHCTVPLKTTHTTWKTWLKKILGKHIWEYEDNIKRNDFNSLLMSTYSGKEPIVDIARAESTYSDGKRQMFKKGSNIYYALIPAYTDDGGHLNKTGRKKVAVAMLSTLVELCH
jgi:hypothetical protein